MPGEILILAEHRDENLAGATREAIDFGRKLASQLGRPASVLILGERPRGLASEISRASGIGALSVSDQGCRVYTPDAYCSVIAQIVIQRSPHLILMGHTYQAIDLAPKLATLLNRGLVAGCIDGTVVDGRLVLVRPVFGGKLHQSVTPRGDPPYLVSLQQGSFRADVAPVVGPAARVVDVTVEPSEASAGRRVLEVLREAQEKIDLSRADVIVAGGRGLGSKENFHMIVDLAGALGGAVGATRPVVDGGWVPKEHQIGVSGQSVTPQLYVACAISGAHQHLVGMRGSRCIVAINKDPEAPIFNHADYGIVGDVFRIIPTLIEMARKVRGGADGR
jgi:electron transfer flavoprotein alpha subunit